MTLMKIFLNTLTSHMEKISLVTLTFLEHKETKLDHVILKRVDIQESKLMSMR